MRLRLADYAEHLRDAGHRLLFPDLAPASGKNTFGDVYFRVHWRKARSELSWLAPGQALHSCRHMVDTELKEAEVFCEFRADLLGHAGRNETDGRYGKSTSLDRMREVVECIPIVTSGVEPRAIQLLPVSFLQPRLVRSSPGRRKRSEIY